MKLTQKVKLNDAVEFKHIADALKDVTSECVFDFSDRGMSIQTLDASNTMMVSIQLHAVAFEEYTCSRPLALGISVPNLAKVLSIARNGDAMYVRAKHDEDEISFVFENKDRKFEFDFRLVHLTGELLEIPDNLEFIRTVEMSSGEFRTSVMDLFALGGDTINIDVIKNELIFTAVNKDMGTARLTFPTAFAEEDVQKVYRSKLLTVVTKGIAFSKTVVLSIGGESDGEQYPVKVSFPMGEKGCVSYYLAEVIPSE